MFKFGRSVHLYFKNNSFEETFLKKKSFYLSFQALLAAPEPDDPQVQINIFQIKKTKL
jgi:hypothetical protein